MAAPTIDLQKLAQNADGRKLAWDVKNRCIVDAEDAPRDGEYLCFCNEQKPLFVRRGPVLRAHFAHYAEGGEEKEHRCRGGWESIAHLSAKERLVTLQGQYSFAYTKCPGCQKESVEQCLGGKMEVEKRSDDGTVVAGGTGVTKQYASTTRAVCPHHESKVRQVWQPHFKAWFGGIVRNQSLRGDPGESKIRV
jgi:hypothetical protein